MIDPGTTGADASTPTQGQVHRFDPQNGTRPKLFSLDLPTHVSSKPPPPRLQPRAHFSNMQPTDPTTSLMDTVEQLQSEIRYASSSNAGSCGSSWLNPASFTTTKVPKFSGSTSWD